MTAPISKSDLAYELPRQTYINVRLEEPNLYLYKGPAEPQRRGLFGWIAQRIAAFVAWNRQRTQAAELRGMTDRELADIGLNRGDIDRVFSSAQAQDLRDARALLGR